MRIEARIKDTKRKAAGLEQFVDQATKNEFYQGITPKMRQIALHSLELSLTMHPSLLRGFADKVSNDANKYYVSSLEDGSKTPYDLTQEADSLKARLLNQGNSERHAEEAARVILRKKIASLHARLALAKEFNAPQDAATKDLVITTQTLVIMTVGQLAHNPNSLRSRS